MYIEDIGRGQVTLLPEYMDDFIPEDSAVRIVDVFVDELDLPRNRTAGEKASAFSESIEFREGVGLPETRHRHESEKRLPSAKVKSVSIGQLSAACLADDPPDNNAASQAC
jgi:hypothetical protein